MQLNQQINFFGEIQGFDNLDKLSPEVREAALAYLSSEQSARHHFVFTEQNNAHLLQCNGQKLLRRSSHVPCRLRPVCLL